MPIGMLCPTCKHYARDNKCPAFPDGIPDTILQGAQDHQKPVRGQVGDVVWEPDGSDLARRVR